MNRPDRRDTANSAAIEDVRHDTRGWCVTAGPASATARRIGAVAASGKLGSGQARRFSAAAAASRSVTTSRGTRSRRPQPSVEVPAHRGCNRGAHRLRTSRDWWGVNRGGGGGRMTPKAGRRIYNTTVPCGGTSGWRCGFRSSRAPRERSPLDGRRWVALSPWPLMDVRPIARPSYVKGSGAVCRRRLADHRRSRTSNRKMRERAETCALARSSLGRGTRTGRPVSEAGMAERGRGTPSRVRHAHAPCNLGPPTASQPAEDGDVT